MPHPVYYLGFPRLSCRSCIFYSPDHWATLYELSPSVIIMLRKYEEELKFTIDNKKSIMEMISAGESMLTQESLYYAFMAIREFPENQSIYVNNWQMPSGAFGKGGGSI